MRTFLALGLLTLIMAVLVVPADGSKQSEAVPAALVAHIDVASDVADVVPDWPAPDPFEGSLSGGPDIGPQDLSLDLAPVAQDPVAESVPVEWIQAGPPSLTVNDAIANARALLGVPYLWGGNSTAGMDCSAYVSRAWDVPRQTTDTLHLVAFPIGREDLLPGDAMNLTTSQDPRGYGHVRMFAAWASTDHSRVWVYEETPRESIYHVIAYDSRYTPMRRANLVADGQPAPLVLAPTSAPSTGSASRTRPPASTLTPTPRTAVPRPVVRTQTRVTTPTASAAAQTPRPAPTAIRPTFTVPPQPTPTRTPQAAATPPTVRPTATPTRTRHDWGTRRTW